MGKNKGLVIELTSLLDVILIMLFWVMYSSSSTADKAEQNAAVQVSQVQSQADEKVKKAQSDAEQAIAEAQKKAENVNSNAAANQQALDGYQQGMLISLNMNFDNGSDTLTIVQNDKTIAEIGSDDDYEQKLKDAFKTLGSDSGTVMLSAVVYDGNTVLYRDIEKLRQAIEKISAENDKIYFTYINTSDNNGGN